MSLSPPPQAIALDPFLCSLIPAIEPSKPDQAQPRLPPEIELQEKSPDNDAAAGQAALVGDDAGGFAAAGDAKTKRIGNPTWIAATKAVRGVRRGRPPLGRRSRGARVKLVNGYQDQSGWVAINNIDPAQPPDGVDQGASRGRTRARGKNRGGRPRIHPLRGSGRATKRRRGDRDDDEGTEKYDTDATENFSPLPAQSRSGRKIFKATTFTPVGVEASTRAEGENLPGQPGQGVGPPKKRRRRGGLNSVCKNCGRGPSPGRNMIVYCDDCNTPWHQHCHDPPISPATARVGVEQWFCADCETAREEKQRLIGKISAEGMSLAEVKILYFYKTPSYPPPFFSLTTFSFFPLPPKIFFSSFFYSLLIFACFPHKSQKRRYLQTLPAHDLIFLLLHATSLHPELPILNSSSAAAAGRAAAAAAAAAEEDSLDYYGLYYPDPDPLPYPRAGNGVRLPPEGDDIGIMMDDDEATFSHRWGWETPTGGAVRYGGGMIHIGA